MTGKHYRVMYFIYHLVILVCTASVFIIAVLDLHKDYQGIVRNIVTPQMTQQLGVMVAAAIAGLKLIRHDGND